jgi:4-amino-4-deoxy-L-arabinose transferase-like glycosyltransferase
MLTRLGADRPEAPPAPATRKVPRPVLLVVLLQAAWMLCVGVVYPPFQAPDEVAHVDYVLAHRHGEWLDGPGERFPQSGTLTAYGSVPATHSERHLSDHHKPSLRSKRQSFDQLGTAPAPPTSLPNQMVQHPPLFYGLAAGYTYLIPHFSSLRFDLQVFWLRLLAVLLLAPVPVLLYLTGMRLFGRAPAALVMALLPLAVPSYLRAGSSVNNDALLVLAGAVTGLLLAHVIAGDLRRRTAALVGLTWGAMLLTKGLALILPPVLVAAFLVGASGGVRERLRAAFVPTLIAGGIGSLLGGWWWVRNLVVFGQIQPTGYGSAWPASRLYGVRSGATNGEFLHGVFDRFVSRVFGSLGLIDGPALPYALVATLLAVVTVLVLIGLATGFAEIRSPRLAALTLMAPAVLCGVLVVVQIHPLYWQSRLFPGIQVRYFLPFITGIVATSAIALHRLAGRFAPWVPVAALTAVAAYQVGVMTWYVAEEFGSASGGAAHRLSTGIDYVVGWTPWPSAYSALCVGLAGISTIALGVALVRAARSDWSTSAAVQ